MNSRFAVIGLGRFGAKIARQLSSKGAEVIAIDEDGSRVDAMRDDVAHAVQADSTEIRTLEALRIHEMDGVVVAIGENFEALLLTVVKLMEMNVKRIIARTGSPQQRKILEKIGVKEILSPEEEIGIIVAERLLHPSVKTFMQLPDNYEIAEVRPPARICNKTVGDIGFSETYNLNLISIKRNYETTQNNVIVMEQHLIGVPKAETIIYEQDEIILMGKSSDLERFIVVNS